METVDYYAVLGVSRDATTVEIKKAYKKLALTHHPDKVPEAEREGAEVRFKEISEAYEILSNEQDRAYYDSFGSKGNMGGMGAGFEDYSDMFGTDDFAQFFGSYGTGGARYGPGKKPSLKKRTEDAHIDIQVTLEEAYKGKVFKMASTRDVLCKTCGGTGGKAKAKPHKCGTCHGEGMTAKLKRVGPGRVASEYVVCQNCKGRGSVYREKEKCRKCTGSGVKEETTILEVYVPRGVKDGHKIVMEGKADEAYGKTTGDIIFTVQITAHSRFKRAGDDLVADINISLSEALCGFSRVVIEHLDGRELEITVPRGKVVRPETYLAVKGEGMPIKGQEDRGTLYLVTKIEFPEDGWCLEGNEIRTLQNILPNKMVNVSNSVVDDANNSGAAAGGVGAGGREIDNVDYVMHTGSVPVNDDEDWEDEEQGGWIPEVDDMNGMPPECAQM